jgi:acylphosphatase
MDSVRKRIIVTGRVQGVGFRYATVEQANRLGIVGTVRNTPDGRVELVAEGPPSQVDALIAWCRRGPSGARVANVHIEDASAVTSTLAGFRIVH